MEEWKFEVPLTTDTPETDITPELEETADLFDLPEIEEEPEAPEAAEVPAAPADEPQSNRPRRRQRSKMQVFKETYLPVLIAGVALLLIVIFIIGSIVRAVQTHKDEKAASESIAASQEAEAARQAKEADLLLNEAAQAAAGYDYESAVKLLDSFTGDKTKFPELTAKRDQYTQALSTTVAWTDPSQIPNLSFHVLINDAERAFADEDYGYSYESNFVTTAEFSNILQQLYDNGYILVSLSDFTEVVTQADGSKALAARTLYLPEGKKPIMITGTNMNYYTYMVDGDGDGLADKDGAGFSSRIVVDAGGKPVNEYINADGTTVSGAYGMVPILDAFIAQHPDFSFRGAKAILAVSGYDGIFGYRINASAKDSLGAEVYAQQVSGAQKVVSALKADGYTLACYTYGNIAYGDSSSTEIQVDLASWSEEIVPYLGNVDVLVYARNSDIGGSEPYSGDSYQVLKNAGFRYYLGASSDSQSWASVEGEYVRQNRLPVTGELLTLSPELYTGLFDAAAVVTAQRDSLS